MRKTSCNLQYIYFSVHYKNSSIVCGLHAGVPNISKKKTLIDIPNTPQCLYRKILNFKQTEQISTHAEKTP